MLTSSRAWAPAGPLADEAAVILPHGDHKAPDRLLRKLLIGLHDLRWSSGEAREHGLHRLAQAQIAGAGAVDEHELERRIVWLAIARIVPEALRAAASLNEAHAHALNIAAAVCENEGTLEAAKEAMDVAALAANQANDAGASVELFSASCAFSAAQYALRAGANTSDASYAAAAAACAYGDRDGLLGALAEGIVGVLEKMGDQCVGAQREHHLGLT